MSKHFYALCVCVFVWLLCVMSGKSDSALNVGLGDLVNANRQGKWYLVGSAWHGAADAASTKVETTNSGDVYSTGIAFGALTLLVGH